MFDIFKIPNLIVIDVYKSLALYFSHVIDENKHSNKN